MDRVDFRPSTCLEYTNTEHRKILKKDYTQYLSKSEKLKNPKLTACGSIATKLTQHFEVENDAKISMTDYQTKSYLTETF